MNWNTGGDNMAKLPKHTYFYLDKVLRSCTRHIVDKSDFTLLDFGCGNQRLRKSLHHIKYTGFDVVKALSDVSDYKSKNYDFVVANHSLEHLTDADLEDFIRYIKRSKPTLLVVALPLENFLSHFLGLLSGVHYSNQIKHYQPWRKILNRLNQEFELKSIETVHFMTITTTWKITP